MPQDVIKTVGTPKSAKPGAGAAPTYPVPMFGIVKDNIDPTRAGRIKVLLSDKPPMDSDTSANWVTVSFLSNFFGRVNGGGGLDGNGTYKSNPSSYGEWHAPPDIGTTVICVFINGDPNYGFYIGCVPEAESLHMVPAIGSSDNIVANEGEAQGFGGATRLPVTNINTNNAPVTNSPEFNSAPRPVHSYSAAIMNQQGIIRDPIRGPISSSASREAASRVGWGVSTPGRPIYQGGYDDSTVVNNLTSDKDTQLQVVARRGGHSLVMDDGDIIGRDQLIRLRTALGHQILMSDDGQTLMILHSNGQSYIELGKEGTIDMYSTNSVNIRTQGDLNLHADQDINMHAMGKFNLQAKSINTNSETTTQMRAATDINFGALGKITGLAGGAIAWGAGGDASMVAGGQAYVNGSKVNLNSGAPGTSPASVPSIPLIAQTDTLHDSTKGYMAAPAKLLTVCSRAPAHAPWANAGQGVDAKTNLDAAASLPPAPSAAVDATNTAGAATGPSPPASATVASAPVTAAPSAGVSTNTTGATLAAQATAAATGPAAAAVTQGAAVIETSEGKVAAVGAFAQTPAQLVSGGVLKPGSATLITGLIQQGANVAHAIPASLFTGASGIGNLTSLIKNTTAQATGIVSGMQKAQTALTTIGAITGKEAPAALTGLVHAATTVGIGSTIGAIKEVSGVLNAASNLTRTLGSGTAGVAGALQSAAGAVSSITGAAGKLQGAVGSISGAVGSISGAAGSLAGSATGALNSATGALSSVTGAANKIGSALSAIGSGGAAAKLATSLTGGLGGVASALTAMSSVPSLNALLDQSKGIAASAFNAIKNSFTPLQAGIPQNLTAIAKATAAAAATIADQTSQASGSLLGKVTGEVSSLAGAAGSVSSLAKDAIGSMSGAVAAVTSTAASLSNIAKATGAVNNSIASVAGEISSVSKSLSSIANAVGGTSTGITVGGITGAANSISAAVTGHALNTTIGGVENAVNNVAAIAGAGSTLAAGGLPALSNAASVIQQGASAATSSVLASGLSNLPGGINTVSAVLNNAKGAVNSIPGANALSGLIDNAHSSAINAISSAAGALGGLTSAASTLTNLTSSATNAVGGALNAVSSLGSKLGSLTSGLSGALSGAASKIGGLTSLASAGLSVGGIAQLQSSIASLASGGPAAINLPTVGFNTNDRTSITAQTTSLLGDPGIPPPNLTGSIPASASNQLESVQASNAELEKQYFSLSDAFTSAVIAASDALDAYNRAQNKYPAGDPAIAAAREAFVAKVNAGDAARDVLTAFKTAHPQFA